jgi:hypothetical protein
MAVSASIKFVQGSNVGTPGVALLGVTGTSVTCSNGSDTGVDEWQWTVISSPEGSAVTPGTTGTSPTFSFDPDITGCYLIELLTTGSDSPSDTATDYRAFGVPQTSGNGLIPSFACDAGSLNFSGVTTGWDPIMRTWLLLLDSLASSGTYVTNITTSAVLPVATEIFIQLDTNAGSLTLTANATSADGDKIVVCDVGLATSVSKTWSITDANGYEFQDPDQPNTFTTTYGPVTTTRNITWRRGTDSRRESTAWYSQ